MMNNFSPYLQVRFILVLNPFQIMIWITKEKSALRVIQRIEKWQ